MSIPAKEVWNMYEKGLNVLQIAARLGCGSPPSLASMQKIEAIINSVFHGRPPKGRGAKSMEVKLPPLPSKK